MHLSLKIRRRYIIRRQNLAVKYLLSEVAQSCPTLCDPIDGSLPGSSVHGIFQARVLEWVAISFSRESSRPRDRTQVSHIVRRCFTVWATREVEVSTCIYFSALRILFYINTSGLEYQSELNDMYNHYDNCALRDKIFQFSFLKEYASI